MVTLGRLQGKEEDMAVEQNWLSMPTQPVLDWQKLQAPYPSARSDWLHQSWTQPSPRCTLRQLWGLIVMGLSLVTLVAIVMTIMAALVIQFYRSDLVMPGVQILGIRVGGLPASQAAALLQERWQQQMIVLPSGDVAYAVTPAVLGITLDAEATVQTAHQYGRSPNLFSETIRAIVGDGVTPVLKLDPAIADKNLHALAPRLETRPVNASVRIRDGRAQIIPPVAGHTLNVTATVASLKQNVGQVVKDGRLSLVMSPIQPAINDIRTVSALAAQLPAGPLSLRAYDPISNQTLTWTVAPQEWGDWLSVSADAHNATKLSWRMDTGKAEAFLKAQTDTLGPDRYLKEGEASAAIQKAILRGKSNVSLRVYHRERQHTVQAGETLSGIAQDHGLPYPWLQQANPGIGGALVAGQTLTIPSPDVLLPLPIIENKRIVVSIGQQKMWAYENGAVKWEWPVSTGIVSSPTFPGVFQIQSHELNAYAANWNLEMPYFMGIYRPVPALDFMNGFHGFPTRNGSQILWTGSLGRPVTYGCILISSDNAALLYPWADEGVVVEVRP
jgi:LysM repeat protein